MLDSDNQNIIFNYQDDGLGIAEAILDHIFEPFFTGQRTGGSGLSLHSDSGPQWDY